jgi:hypothetical protein
VNVPLAYKILLRAYPRSFRERFGPEMALLFLDRRREGASGYGLVLCEAVDCARVAPRLHLESPMSRNVIAVVLVTATVMGAVLGGPIGLIPAVLLAVVLLGLRNERPIGAMTGTRWWAWFVGAVGSFAVFSAVLAIDGDELSGAGWMTAFVTGNAAIVLAVIGVGNGIFRLLSRARTAPAA